MNTLAQLESDRSPVLVSRSISQATWRVRVYSANYSASASDVFKFKDKKIEIAEGKGRGIVRERGLSLVT